MEGRLEETSALIKGFALTKDLRVKNKSSFVVRFACRILCISPLIFLWLVPYSFVVAEVKIQDSLGLIRAFNAKSGAISVEVSIQLSGEGSEVLELSLINTDGILPDIRPVKINETKYVFNGVGDGTWRLNSTSPETRFLEVKILK